MKFSIGYNFDTKALDILDAYKNNIESFYFPIPGEYLGSGRSIKEPGSYSAQIPRIIRKCGSLKINSQLLLNATCEGKDGATKAHFERVLNFIKRLKDKGLNSVVITNPVYIGMIKKRIKGLRIESSVNCYVRTVEHALYLKDLGVDVLTIDRDINRDIPLIRRIKEKTGLKLKLMLNEGCLGNCPYRISHYNLLAHGVPLPQKNMEGVFFDRFCIQIYTKDPFKVLRVPFVPPEEAGRYKQFIDYYKLSTRIFSTKRMQLCLKSYIDGRFSGNLLELLDCPGLAYFEFIDYAILRKNGFFKKMLKCGLECGTCGYCRSLFKKAVLIRRNDRSERSKEDELKSIDMYEQELKNLDDRADKLRAYLKIGEAYSNLRDYSF